MLFNEIKEILASQLEIDEDSIEMTSDIYDDLGADKFDMVDIVMTIEDEYSVEVTDEALSEIKLVEDLVYFVEAKLD